MSDTVNIDKKEYESFKKFRINVVNSHQYYDFYSKTKKLNKEDFNQKFLLARNFLMKSHRDFWLTLEKPTKFKKAILVDDS